MPILYNIMTIVLSLYCNSCEHDIKSSVYIALEVFLFRCFVALRIFNALTYIHIKYFSMHYLSNTFPYSVWFFGVFCLCGVFARLPSTRSQVFMR